jgi:hypothetical protein
MWDRAATPVLVAQVFNLLYRRLAVGGSFGGPRGLRTED